MTRLFLLPLLALAACQGQTTNEAAQPSDVETLPPDETALVNQGDGTAAVVPASTKIPEALQGRWGMTPADCTSTRGDAKGLMTVGADTIGFYESRAALEQVVSAEPDRFAGAFTLTGEGQSWRSEITLIRQDDTLTRAEDGQRFTYGRCA